MSDNPYSPPESNLDLPAGKLRESIWWNIFFVLSVLMMLLGLIGIAVAPNMPLSVYDSLDFLVSLPAMVGLFGFAFSRRIGRVKFWRGAFYFVVAESLWYILLLPMAGVSRLGDTSSFDAFHALELIYSLFIFRALYLYAFKRDLIWNPI